MIMKKKSNACVSSHKRFSGLRQPNSQPCTIGSPNMAVATEWGHLAVSD